MSECLLASLILLIPSEPQLLAIALPRDHQIVNNMSDKELASSASSNNHHCEQQHTLSDEEKAPQTVPEGDNQDEGKEDRRQLTGVKVQLTLVPACYMWALC